MKTRLLPVFLSILLLTSIFIPVVNAEPVFLAPAAAPEVCEIVVAGVTVVVCGAILVEIGENLGKTWDGIAENWDKFVKNVSTGLDKVFAKQWIKATSNEAQSVMTVIYEYYSAGSPKGKKDGKWHFEALRNHGEIEINPKRMDETQAVKEMGRGKDIMTLNKELAQNLVGRFKGLTEKATKDLEFEGRHDPAAEKFLHLHYEAHGMRLHCWSWK